MNPGDQKWLPDESFIFIDGGFLSKLSFYFGNNKYLRYIDNCINIVTFSMQFSICPTAKQRNEINAVVHNIIKFAENLCAKQKLTCKRIYYYTAPPFQSANPDKNEEKRREDYDRFINKITVNKKIIIREGRCQRLKINNKYEFNQKAVDSLAIIDLMEVPLENKNIKKIVLIACDSDFVPVVKRLEEKGIKVILYTYYQKSRDENFSTSNNLIKAVWKYVIITKEDFTKAPP